MLMLTHTWILKELLALSSSETPTLDIFAYNVCPDLLPIHRTVHASMTHRISRFIQVPREYRKAHYVQLHLLADDIAHHGRICEEVVTEFNPDADGYAYVMGQPLVGPIMDYCNSFGLPVDRVEAAAELPTKSPQKRPSKKASRFPAMALRTPTATPVAAPMAAGEATPWGRTWVTVICSSAEPSGAVAPAGTTITQVASFARKAAAYSLLMISERG